MLSKRLAWVLTLLLVLICHVVYPQQLLSYQRDGLTLFYEEVGSGPALYILSGGPGEAPDRPYHEIADSLKAFYTCVIVHQRGSGASRNIPINDQTITIANYTHDLEALRQKRGDKKITLLGMSWGGLLAMS